MLSESAASAGGEPSSQAHGGSGFLRGIPAPGRALLTEGRGQTQGVRWPDTSHQPVWPLQAAHLVRWPSLCLGSNVSHVLEKRGLGLCCCPRWPSCTELRPSPLRAGTVTVPGSEVSKVPVSSVMFALTWQPGPTLAQGGPGCLVNGLGIRLSLWQDSDAVGTCSGPGKTTFSLPRPGLLWGGVLFPHRAKARPDTVWKWTLTRVCPLLLT